MCQPTHFHNQFHCIIIHDEMFGNKNQKTRFKMGRSGLLLAEDGKNNWCEKSVTYTEMLEQLIRFSIL